MSQKTPCRLFISVDINPAYISCWKKHEGLPRQYYFIIADVRCLNKILLHKFSVILCNPPYYRVENGRVSPYYSRALARHELALNLKDIFRVSRELLRKDGRLYMIHKPFRLQELIVTANEYGFYIEELKPVKITSDKEQHNQASHILLLFRNRTAESRIVFNGI